MLLLLLSIIINLNSTDYHGFNTVILLIVSFMLLTLSPVSMNYSFLSSTIKIYLFLALSFSLYYYAMQVLGSAIGFRVPNANYHVNPNAASSFFFNCLLLTIVFMTGMLRQIYILLFYLLILSTGSRTGFIVSTCLLVAFPFQTGTKLSLNALSVALTKRLFLFVVFAGVFYFLLPDTFYLREKMGHVGLDLSAHGKGLGRTEIWELALERSLSSLQTIMFGAGFGKVINDLNIGMHSSYIWVVVSAGWPFLISIFLFVMTVLYRHKEANHFSYIIIALSILVYGAFEAVLFNGLSSIWFMFIFLSICFHCRWKGEVLTTHLRDPSLLVGTKVL